MLTRRLLKRATPSSSLGEATRTANLATAMMGLIGRRYSICRRVSASRSSSVRLPAASLTLPSYQIRATCFLSAATVMASSVSMIRASPCQRRPYWFRSLSNCRSTRFSYLVGASTPPSWLALGRSISGVAIPMGNVAAHLMGISRHSFYSVPPVSSWRPRNPSNVSTVEISTQL